MFSRGIDKQQRAVMDWIGAKQHQEAAKLKSA